MSNLLKLNLVNLQFVEFVLVNFALLSMYLVAGHGTEMGARYRVRAECGMEGSSAS